VSGGCCACLLNVNGTVTLSSLYGKVGGLYSPVLWKCKWDDDSFLFQTVDCVGCHSCWNLSGISAVFAVRKGS
jgi:hypothetical protein